MKKTKLNIGSGSRPMNGILFNKDNEWLDLDFRKSIKSIHGFNYVPDIIADASHIPAKDNEYSELLVHSVLEHFSKWEFKNYLKEWYRILNNGGKIVISVPDILKISKGIIMYSNIDNHKAVKSLINLLYGEQNYPGNLHKWGFIKETLKQDLEEIGFSRFRILKSERYTWELCIEAYK
jgi:predicted SAM-dependent methyltransferase